LKLIDVQRSQEMFRWQRLLTVFLKRFRSNGDIYLCSRYAEMSVHI
jgi:hypothetical protein